MIVPPDYAPPVPNPAPDASPPPQGIPEGWSELKGNADIQFAPVETLPPPPPEPPPEPGWFAEAITDFFRWLGEVLGPIGTFIAWSWPVLQWVLVALVVVFVIYLVVRTIGPLAGRNHKNRAAQTVPEWQPDREESIALLEDADALAAEGRFDEAVHTLLIRSVRQIAEARPDWVEPSSTARELAALPALSDAARRAFGTISERVEASLFALRALDRTDWEVARKAYSDFALARIVAPPDPGAEAQRALGFGRKVAT